MMQLWNMSDAPEVRAKDKGRLHDLNHLNPLEDIGGLPVLYAAVCYPLVN